MRKNLRNNVEIGLKEIASGSYAFVWKRSVGGYGKLDHNTHCAVAVSTKGVEEVHGAPPPWLVPNGQEVEGCAPLSGFTLHRKFARLHSDESIIDFAGEYGLLGAQGVQLVPHGGGAVDYGESLYRWREHICDMGVLLYLWELVQRDDAGKLGQLVKWSGRSVSIAAHRKYDKKNGWQACPVLRADSAKPGYFAAAISQVELHPGLVKRWNSGQVIEPAKFYIYREINARLKGHVAPQVLPFWDDRIFLFPDSLLSAMWVLFLMELTGKSKLRQCDLCGEWKEEKLKRDPFYCSDLCRVNAHYRRHKGGSI